MAEANKKNAVKVEKNPDPKAVVKKTKEDKAAERAAARVITKFRLTETLPNFKKGGQVELIVQALQKLKVGTINQITEHVKGSLATRQNPKQVVSFYMTQMKKAGNVEVVEEKAKAA